ncbi:MAG TPA: hypothetical protein VD866_12725 [Urbifossiella sp.]|nr:hypothetical protein [Urbifossiella sp.]
MDWSAEHAILRQWGVELAPGLTDTELSRAEEHVGCAFPPDLRSFLQAALPVGKNWPDWRHPESEYIASRLGWAERGMMFDLEHCPWWWPPEWGLRPEALPDRIEAARGHLRTVPKLIPVVGHRFLPAEPCEAGNPVLSVWQMVDTIYYGRDLRDFFNREADSELRKQPIGRVRRIRFWSGVVEEWYKRPG